MTRLRCQDYHVAWISPLVDVELLPARLMLDDEHDPPEINTQYDDNTYLFGSLQRHNVVIACCPSGMTGNVNAGRLTGPLFKTFPNIQMALLVGIGGGVPQTPPPSDPYRDVHLGDVVVGWPGDGKPGCVYYDSGKHHHSGRLEIVGTMDRPDWRLLSGLDKVISDHDLRRSGFADHKARLASHPHFARPDLSTDRLFRAEHYHQNPGTSGCRECDPEQLVERPCRPTSGDDFVFHRGRIASGNMVIRDAKRRDQIYEMCGGVFSIEMEAAGVDAAGKCLSIRGISDYADSHKNDHWKYHAAANAAIFARELLCQIQPLQPQSQMATTLSVEKSPGTAERHFMVPFDRNLDFVGRTREVELLLEKIRPRATNEVCQKASLEGLGGIGKTQIALEISYRVRADHPNCSIFWVSMTSADAFRTAYQQIGRQLGLDGVEGNTPDAKNGTPFGLNRVKRAVEESSTGDWLMVLDNADDIELMRNDVVQFLPTNSRGSWLVTTRNPQVLHLLNVAPRNRVVVSGMADTDASDLLHRGLYDGTHTDPESVLGLLDILAHLPLAIKQASAFMTETRISIAKYLERCRASDSALVELLSQEPETADRCQDSRDSVATTWLITFQHLSRDFPDSSDLLKLMSFYSEKDIPMAFLQVEEHNQIRHLRALGVLKAYSFITEREGGESFDMHRLVRLITRNWIQRENSMTSWVDTGIAHLMEPVQSFNAHDHRTLHRYLAHTETFLRFHHIGSDKTAACDVLMWVGYGYYRVGNDTQSEAIFRKAVREGEDHFGPTHWKTVEAIDLLSMPLSNLVKYDECGQLRERVVNIKLAAFGPEHLTTLKSMGSLASAWSRNGRYKEAANMLEKIVLARKRLQGVDHVDTLDTMVRLGSCFRRLGNFRKAEELLNQVSFDAEVKLGLEHKVVLGTAHQLLTLLYELGRYEQAVTVASKYLPTFKKIYGKRHPRTLKVVKYQGSAMHYTGHTNAGLKMLREAHEGFQEVCGPTHPDVVRVTRDLAGFLFDQGDAVTAYALVEKCHLASWQLEGPQSFASIDSMNDLAWAHDRMGDFLKAEQTQRRVVHLAERYFGLGKEDTLRYTADLANSLWKLGQLEEAYGLLTEVYESQSKLLHTENLDCVWSRERLEYWRERFSQSSPKAGIGQRPEELESEDETAVDSSDGSEIEDGGTLLDICYSGDEE